MTVTYITPDAELDDLIARNEAGTARMVEILNAEETIEATLPTPPLRQQFPLAWAAVVAMAFCGGLGIGALML